VGIQFTGAMFGYRTLVPPDNCAGEDGSCLKLARTVINRPGGPRHRGGMRRRRRASESVHRASIAAGMQFALFCACRVIFEVSLYAYSLKGAASERECCDAEARMT